MDDRERPLSTAVRFPVALVMVAVGAALFAVAFRLALAWVYRTLYGASDVVRAFEGIPWWARLLVPITGAGLAGLLTHLTARKAQGVSNVMEAVALGRIQLSLRATLSRVSSSWTAIAAGASIGREGPLIEFGGSLGAAIGRRVRLSVDHTRVLVAAGTAAGFAAAYNTPFAASLFVLETIAGIASPTLLLPVLASTAIATTVTRSIVGAGPIYGQRTFAQGGPAALLWFAVLGASAALVAMAFKSALSACERGCTAIRAPQPLRAMMGGAVVGLVAVGLPQVVGNGYEPINDLLNGTQLPYSIAILVLAKMVVTSMTVGSGIPGGVFTPMLLIGAAVGTLFGQHPWLPVQSWPEVGSCALVGMAAATAASIHAPLTAAVMVFELSGDYAVVLPLLAATVTATAVSRLLGSSSVYDAELRKRGLGWELTLEGRRLDPSARALADPPA